MIPPAKPEVGYRLYEIIGNTCQMDQYVNIEKKLNEINLFDYLIPKDI